MTLIERAADRLEPARCRQPIPAGEPGTRVSGGVAPSPDLPKNAFTVDVEDYFQVQAFAGVIPTTDWDHWPRRVEANTDRFLDLLDSARVTGTFFILGWVAERHPDLVRRIAAGGHEIASHGMSHVQVWRQTPAEFRADVRRTKRILEDLSGTPVTGYRAASFSIDQERFWAHRVLLEEGHRYSSSIYPIRHDLYGMAAAPRTAFAPAGADGVVELPMTTVQALGRRWPCSGGGYFRLLPYEVSRRALQRINHRDGLPGIFYTHPWEIDPDHPRPKGLSLKSRFRHTINLRRTADRIQHLLRDFAWDRMDRVFAATIAATDTG